MNLKDQLVVVVGGSSGIGRATAKAALTAGARVVVTSRSVARARQIAVEIAGAQPRDRVFSAQVELGNEASITALANAFSHADHVFIAAGATKLASPLDAEPLESLLTAFDDRVRGSLRVIRAFAPTMKPGSSFVFTGGLSTDRPVKGAWVSGIGTSTAEQLARVMAMELAPLRFNAVSPGWTDTPMWDAVLGDNKAAVLREVSSKWLLPRLVTADEVAEAVVFLMSNGAMNGEVLHIDGGQRLT